MEEQHQLISFLTQHHALTKSCIQQIQQSWTRQECLKKGDFLIYKGEVERRIYFVLEGSFRIYFPKESQEICVGFGYKDTVLTSYPSLIKGEPSQYFIQAVSKAKVVSIHLNELNELIAQHTEFAALWNLFIQEALLGKIERETEVLTYSPVERLRILLKRSPHLFQYIPQKYIASYLGMAPETLSRQLKNI